MAQTTERDLQAAIAEVLERHGVPFEREVVLSPRDKPDFMVAPGLCLEVKIKGSASEVRRQLVRYALSSRVEAMLLVTTKSLHVMPPELEGKTVMTIFVGSAFL